MCHMERDSCHMSHKHIKNSMRKKKIKETRKKKEKEIKISVLAHKLVVPWRANLGFRISMFYMMYSRS